MESRDAAGLGMGVQSGVSVLPHVMDDGCKDTITGAQSKGLVLWDAQGLTGSFH